MAESLLVGVSPLLFFLCLCNGVNTQCPLTRRLSSVTFILNPKHAHQQGRLNWSKPYVHMSAAVVKLPTPRVSLPWEGGNQEPLPLPGIDKINSRKENHIKACSPAGTIELVEAVRPHVCGGGEVSYATGFYSLRLAD